MSPIGFKSKSRLATSKTTLTLPKKAQKAVGSLEPRTLLAIPRGDDKSIGRIAHCPVGRRDLLGGRPVQDPDTMLTTDRADADSSTNNAVTEVSD